MESSRERRTHLGSSASAALPALWKALARLGWSHAEFARRMEVTSAAATRLLYGDCRAGRRVGGLVHELLGVKPALWDKACPPNWKPHAYDQLRPGAKRSVVRKARRVRASAPPPAAASSSTGTDG